MGRAVEGVACEEDEGRWSDVRQGDHVSRGA
jgi:hypothetical protein